MGALILAMFFGEALSAADGLVASDEAGWPQWRGSRRDGISSDKGLLGQWPTGGPKQRWKSGGLGQGWSAPIIHNSTIYLTGDVEKDLVIFALDLDGKLKWKKTNGRSWTGSYPGSRSSCTISQGVLFHMNAHGRVTALKARSGQEIWSANVAERFGAKTPRWAYSESLLVDGKRLIVTPAGAKALVVALDKTTGQTIWSSEPITGETAGYASPILFVHKGRRLIANYTNPNAWAVEAETGKLLWKVELKTRWGASVATPLYADGGLFMVAPDGPGGHRLDLDGEKPKQIWRTTVDTLTGSSLYVGGRLYAQGCKATKLFHAIDWKSGKTLFELPRFTARRPGHAGGALLWAEGRIYGLFEDGHVALIEPKAQAFEVAGKFKLVDARRDDAWAHPVLLNGRLYLRYHQNLWCFDVDRQQTENKN